MLSGCNISNHFYVTSYQTVSGEDATPWPVGCLVTIENRTQTVIGIKIDACEHIKIGDKGVFNKESDKVFWINDEPYHVRSAQARH